MARDKLSIEDILRIERAVRREMAKEDGYYDGRNRPSRTTDRKKARDKKRCRGRVNQEEY